MLKKGSIAIPPLMHFLIFAIAAAVLIALVVGVILPAMEQGTGPSWLDFLIGR